MTLKTESYFSENPEFPSKLIVATLFIGAFFGYLNDTLLNVALPTLMTEFQVEKTTVQWLVTGFLLVMGAFTPISASLIEWFETRKLVLATQFTFIVGSAICTFATQFEMLLVGRMVQAISAALFVPLLFNAILAIYPPHQRGMAMGIVMMMFTVAPAMGPTISGVIIDYFNWRYLFGLTVPFMLLAMLITSKFLTVRLNEITRPKIDLLSAFLSIAGLSGLVYASSNFAALSLSAFFALMVMSLALIVWFSKRQFSLATPLLNLRAFHHAQFRYAVIILVCAYFLFMGLEVMMPMYTQQVLMFSATATGLILMPASISQAIAAPIFGGLLDKKGGRWVLLPATMLLVGALILMWFWLDLTTSTLLLSALFALMTLSVSACITGETHGLNALTKELNPHGTAILTTVSPIAAALGTSFFVGMINIGEHLSNELSSQQATLNGVHLSMASALIIAVIALWFAFKIKPHLPKGE